MKSYNKESIVKAINKTLVFDPSTQHEVSWLGDTIVIDEEVYIFESIDNAVKTFRTIGEIIKKSNNKDWLFLSDTFTKFQKIDEIVIDVQSYCFRISGAARDGAKETSGRFVNISAVEELLLQTFDRVAGDSLTAWYFNDKVYTVCFDDRKFAIQFKDASNCHNDEILSLRRIIDEKISQKMSLRELHGNEHLVMVEGAGTIISGNLLFVSVDANPEDKGLIRYKVKSNLMIYGYKVLLDIDVAKNFYIALNNLIYGGVEE